MKVTLLTFPLLLLIVLTSGCPSSGDKSGTEVDFQEAGKETSGGLSAGSGTVTPETCFNEVADPGETDIDCGGPDCPKCQPGAICQSVTDCETDPYKMLFPAFREAGQQGGLNVQCVDKINLSIPGYDALEMPTPDGEKRCISEELFLALFKDQAPQVSLYTPTATNSPLDAPIGVVFNYLMDPGSVSQSLVLVTMADFYQKFVTGSIDNITPIPATVAPWPGLYSVYVLTPSAPLDYGTFYVAIVNGANKDKSYIDSLAPREATSIAGATLEDDVIWSFQTEAPPGDPPCPGPCENGKHCSGGVCRCNLSHAADTPNGPCTGCETGYLNTELDPNKPVACKLASAVPVPTISGSIPSNGATNLTVGGLDPYLGIWIFFSEPMDPESLKNAVKVYYGGTAQGTLRDMALIESAGSLNGENTLFKFMPIMPQVLRQADTSYIVTINNDSKSAVGVNMAAETRIDFKTAATPMPLSGLRLHFTRGEVNNSQTDPSCQFLFRACPSKDHAMGNNAYQDCLVVSWNPHKDPDFTIEENNQIRDPNANYYLMGRSLDSLHYPYDFYYMDVTGDLCQDKYYLGAVEVIGYRAEGDNFHQPFDIYINQAVNSWIGLDKECWKGTCIEKTDEFEFGIPNP